MKVPQLLCHTCSSAERSTCLFPKQDTFVRFSLQSWNKRGDLHPQLYKIQTASNKIKLFYLLKLSLLTQYKIFVSDVLQFKSAFEGRGFMLNKFHYVWKLSETKLKVLIAISPKILITQIKSSISSLFLQISHRQLAAAARHCCLLLGSTETSLKTVFCNLCSRSSAIWRALWRGTGGSESVSQAS